MRSRLPVRALAPCAVVALIALALAGCGSGSSRSPQAILSDAATASESVKSCTIDFTTTMTLDPPASPGTQSSDSDESESARITGHAVVGTDPAVMDLVVTLSTPEDGDDTAEVRVVDGTTYIQEDDVWYRLPGRTVAGPDRTAEMQAMLHEAGLDTQDWLADLENQGVEEVDGREVYHLSAGIDTARLASGVVALLKDPDFQALLPKQQAQALASSGLDEADLLAMAKMVTDTHVDYWVSTENDLPVRLDLSARIDPPFVEGTEEQGATVQTGVTFRQSNEPANVVVPADARPWKESQMGSGSSTSIAAPPQDSAVMEGIHSIQVGVQSWAVDHDDQYPPVSVVNKAGLHTYVDNWPTNPYTGGPMTLGKGPGQYSYSMTEGESSSFKLVGRGAEGAPGSTGR